jgi:hypothetical protein
MESDLEQKVASPRSGIWTTKGPEHKGSKATRVTWCLALACFLMIGPTSSARAKNPAANPKLCFRVYNYAHVDRWQLSDSENMASAIFKQAGVETVWVDCPLSAMEIPTYPDCQRQMGRTDLVLKILPRSMEIGLSVHGEPLGWAVPCSDGPGCEIRVFYDQVQDMATDEYHIDRILGHVIAHEAGHILLGPGAHSRVGIMRAPWSPRDLHRISLGFPLAFTDDQRRRLRANLLAADEN